MELEIVAYKRHAAVVKYRGNEEHVVIPEVYENVPVTQIAENAFKDNPTLEDVELPATMECIGDGAFDGCGNLIFVGSKNEMTTVESVLADDEEGPMAAHRNGNMIIVNIFPEKLRTIGARAFAGTALKNVIMESGLVHLGESAFEDCSRLMMVALPKCDELSMDNAVFRCSSIKWFHAPRARLDSVPSYTFSGCRNLECMNARINAVGDRSFFGCANLTDLNGPKNLRSVGAEAFSGCERLRKYAGAAKRRRKKPVEITPTQEADLPGTRAEVPIRKESEEAEPTGTPAKAPEKKEVQKTKKDCLLRLKIKTAANSPDTMPDCLTGILVKRNRNFEFEVEIPFSLRGVGLNVQLIDEKHRFQPMVRYLADKKVTLMLQGSQNDDFYDVDEIRTICSSGQENTLPMRFLDEMILRLGRPVPHDIDLTVVSPPTAILKEWEYEAYLDICADIIPGWVVREYRKNRSIIAANGVGYRNDEVKHAKRTLEVLLNVDWTPCALHLPDAREVRRILDEEFYGMEQVKDRIEEVVSRIRRTGRIPKWGIMLQGDAGTGKTSVAKAIARIFGLPLIQMDMSTLGDDADEISGSSRIYANARPGMMAEEMFRNRSSCGILLANEVDKIGRKGGRNSADILLTILDKTGFYENFLETQIPTDNLFCIGTCNEENLISKPLLDRFEIIRIPAYTPEEKRIIFEHYVLPKAMGKARISPDRLKLTGEAMDLLIAEYALEPGARDLERYAERFIGNYCRCADRRNDLEMVKVYTSQDLRTLLGSGSSIVHHIVPQPGMVNAAYYDNGAVRFVLLEASVQPGTGKFEVLGSVDKLQQEYCRIAYRSVCHTLGARLDLSEYDVTVFASQPIPSVQGNQLGLACFAAICSRILNVTMGIGRMCFIGGCDLFGGTYFEESSLAPLLRATNARGITTVFAPLGTGRLVNAGVGNDSRITIVEGPDAGILFSLAASQSKMLG